jgi:hypothetical protein
MGESGLFLLLAAFLAAKAAPLQNQEPIRVFQQSVKPESAISVTGRVKFVPSRLVSIDRSCIERARPSAKSAEEGEFRRALCTTAMESWWRSRLTCALSISF